jgi:hypothetical protein
MLSKSGQCWLKVGLSALVILLATVLWLGLLSTPDATLTVQAQAATPPSTHTANTFNPTTTTKPASTSPILSTATPALPVASVSKVKLSVAPGVAGYARSGDWIPVEVTLENAGLDADGEVVVNIAPASNGYNPDYITQAYASVYVQKVTLPSGSKKQVTMFVPFTGNTFNRTLVVDYNGYLNGDTTQLKNLATSTTTVDVLSNNLLVGVFSTTPDHFATRTDLQLPGLYTGGGAGKTSSSPSSSPSQLSFVILDPAHLPDLGQALDSLNVILLQDYDLSIFSAKQWQAITIWVNSGGILLLSGGPGAIRAIKNLPTTLAPVEPIGPNALVRLDAANQAGLEQLGGVALPPIVNDSSNGSATLIASLMPKPNAITLLNYTRTLPLAVGLNVGSGAVVMTAFDLGDLRLLNWDGISRLWSALLRPYLISSQVFSSFNLYGINSTYQSSLFYQQLTNIPGLAIPSLKLMAVLALIYIILVGPFSYLVLKVLKRNVLAWIVLPLITLLFCMGIYLFALKDKGSDLITSSVGVVRLPDSASSSGPQVRPVLQMVGVFAPKDSNNALVMPAGTLVRSIDQPVYNAPSIPQPSQIPFPNPTPLPEPPVGLRIVQGDHSQVDLVGMKQWTFRSVLAEGTVQLAGSLDSDLADISGFISGTVTNRTGRPLNDVVVVGAYGLQRLGNIAVGETVSVKFKNAFGVQSSSDFLFRDPNPRSANSSADQRTEQRKQLILETIAGVLPTGISNASVGYYSYNRTGLPHDNTALTILAWDDQPLLNYTVDDRKLGGNDLTLFVNTPHLNLAASNELLPGLVQGTVTDLNSHPSSHASNSTSSYPSASYSYNATILEVGDLTVTYSLHEFGPQGVLRLVGKHPDTLLLSNIAAMSASGYGQAKALVYASAIYNWKTGNWDAIPTYLAPPLCLPDILPYTGSGSTGSVQILQARNISSSASNACSRSLTSYPRASAATATARPVSPSSTSTITGSAIPSTVTKSVMPTVTPISANMPSGYSYNGQNFSFSVLGDGPGFVLADHLSPTGEVRVRYSRDNSNTDQLLFFNFSIGYTIRNF